MKKSADSRPLVSVIVPTYNRAATLRRAIDSVRRQTYDHWELIIVDDGSTDETSLILDSYTSAFSNIRSLRRGHSGPAHSRNAGLEQAGGVYIACLDSDDEFTPGHLELRLAYLRRHPDIRLLHGGVLVVGPEQQHFVPDKDDRTRMIRIEDCAVGGTFFGYREVFIQAGGWRECYAEDAELLQRIARIHPVARVDWPTYIYHRDGPDGRCDQAGREARDVASAAGSV